MSEEYVWADEDAKAVVREKEEEKPKRKPRGFATMSQEKRRAIAASGAATVTARGTRHKFTHEELSLGGHRGGGQWSREHMAEIGRKGGLSPKRKRAKRGEDGT